jgi:succinate dehydrogenase / fumarate reductase cytochrome b subunit
MALAGITMLGYLIFHMITNLSFFSEQSFSDFYSWYNGGPVRWLVLLILAATIFIHVNIAMRIRQKNAQARTVDYFKHDKFKIPAHLVTASILFLLLFIIVHVIQTLSFETSDVYGETVTLFQSELMVLFYLAGLFVLTMHLQHSLANVLQTLGKTSLTCHLMVWIGTLLLTGGLALIPLYSYFVMP